MNYSIFRFTLNMHTHRSQASVSAFRGDTAVRLLINITDGGIPYLIEDGCTAVLSGTKADGTKLHNRCVIENNTTIKYDFTEQTSSCVGVANCEITLYDAEGKIVTAPKFVIVIDEREVKDDDIIDSVTEHTAVDAIFASEGARIIAEEARVEAETARSEAEASRADAEAVRIERENARSIAETARVNAETSRVTAEETRASEEATRQSNEEARVAAEAERQAHMSVIYKPKGSVDTYAELPTDATTGDVYNVVEAYDNHPSGTNWVWTGEAWDALGGTVDLSSYATKKMTEQKLDKFDGSSETGDLRFTVYGQLKGEQQNIPFSSSAKEGAIVQYTSGGRVVVGEPNQENHATPRKYVDDLHTDHEERIKAIELVGGAGAEVAEAQIKEIVVEETDGKFTPDVSQLKKDGAVGAFNIPAMKYDGTYVYKVATGQSWAQGDIPIRTTQGAIFIPSCSEYNHAANKKYVDDTVSAVDTRVTKLRDITKTIDPDAFLEPIKVENNAYSVTVPEDADSVALLNSISGVSRASKNKLDLAVFTKASSEFTAVPNKYVQGQTILQYNGPNLPTDETGENVSPDFMYEERNYEFAVPLEAGTYKLVKTVIRSTNTEMVTFAFVDTNTGAFVDTVTLNEAGTAYIYMQVYLVNSNSPGAVYTDFDYYVMVCSADATDEYEDYFAGLRHAPVTEVISKDSSGEVLQNIAIPSEIQALEGYGQEGFLLDFDTKTATYNGTTTDVSEYLTDYEKFKDISVAPNGTVTFENEHKYAVPSVMTFSWKEVEV